MTPLAVADTPITCGHDRRCRRIPQFVDADVLRGLDDRWLHAGLAAGR
jgi:hypothetical protein